MRFARLDNDVQFVIEVNRALDDKDNYSLIKLEKSKFIHGNHVQIQMGVEHHVPAPNPEFPI